MGGFAVLRRRWAVDGNPSMGAVLTIATQHGIELLGPIPDLVDDRVDSR